MTLSSKLTKALLSEIPQILSKNNFSLGIPVEGNDNILFKKLSGKEERHLYKNVVIFAFFLLIAFVFWYLNALGKEIKSDFKCSVTFVNPPKGRALSGELPSKLTLELKGQGYSLLKRKFSGNMAPLVVDLSKVTVRRLADSQLPKYYFFTAGIIPSFKKQIGNGIELLSIKPDTVFLTFRTAEDISDKKVK